MIFCVTFGQSSPFRNNWVEVEAINEHFARLAANYALGKWSMIYPLEEFIKQAQYHFESKVGERIVGEMEENV